MSSIPLYICIYIYTHTHIFFIHSSVNKHLGCFCVLNIANSAAINNGVRDSFWIIVFFRYMPRSGTAGWYGSSTFRVLRNFQAVLHSGCTNLHSYQQCRSITFYPTPLQHLLFVDFFFFNVHYSTGVSWYFFTTLIWISLIINHMGMF